MKDEERVQYSEIEGTIDISLEEGEYIDDFKNFISKFRNHFSPKGFRGVSTPSSIIYQQYGYDFLRKICFAKCFDKLDKVKKEKAFSNNIFFDAVLVGTNFPVPKDIESYSHPGSFLFRFQYGIVRNIEIPDDFFEKLSALQIEEEKCEDLSEGNIETLLQQLSSAGENKEGQGFNINKLIEDRNFINSLFLTVKESFDIHKHEWIFSGENIDSLIKKPGQGISSQEEFKALFKENAIFVLNYLLQKVLRATIREKCIELFNIEIPVEYLCAKIRASLQNHNDKTVEFYLPLFENVMKWECIRTVIKKKYEIEYTQGECEVYDILNKFLSTTPLYKKYDKIFSGKVTPGTYDNFDKAELAVSDFKVIDFIKKKCSIKAVKISGADFFNKLSK